MCVDIALYANRRIQIYNNAFFKSKFQKKEQSKLPKYITAFKVQEPLNKKSKQFTNDSKNVIHSRVTDLIKSIFESGCILLFIGTYSDLILKMTNSGQRCFFVFAHFE